MENQSTSHPQHPMSDQGFRPFTSLMMSTLSTPDQQPNSSTVNTASIQMPPLQYHPEPNGISMCPADDGYIWRIIPGSGGPTIHYECIQANCWIKKSVTFSLNGQIETVFRGSHNHPRPSERRPRDGLGGYGPGSQGYVAPGVYAAGTSMAVTTEGDREGSVDQLVSSSDSEENDDGEERADGDVAAAGLTERQVTTPAERVTVQTRSGTSHRRRSKSKVWEEFTAVFRDGKIQGAVCKHCEKSLSGKTTGGTSHLRRHLKTCPAGPAIGRVQQKQPSVQKNWKLYQDKYLEFLTKAVASDICSFSLTSCEEFREFFSETFPTYDVVSPSAVREKFLSIFQSEKLKLMEKIALAPGGVFLAVTRWCLECKEFICVTVHFIDREWKMNRKIIRCSYLKDGDASTPYYISTFQDCQSYYEWYDKGGTGIMEKVIQDWNLQQKLLGITLYKSLRDADINIIGLQENLTGQNYLLAKYKLLTLPCIVDALNDLLGWSCPNDLIVNISKDWFDYMTCSPLRRERYKDILSKLHLNQPSFGSQKWHWTYCLLEAALQFNKELPNPERMDLQRYPSKPSNEKLQAAENFCNLVRPIYCAIKMFYSPPNAALNSHFHTIWRLKIALMGSSGKRYIYQLFKIVEMQNKFDKLWSKWYIWLSLSVVMDPRYKIRFLDFPFKQAFGTDAKRYILEVHGKMYELFLQYSCHVDQHSSVQLSQTSNNLQCDANGSVPVNHTSDNYIEQSVHEEFRELIQYLEGACIPQSVNFDILKWWKDNALMYPTLSRLAPDILAIPGSAVSAESAAFDETDERVNLFNKKVSPEIIEALICSQDWTKSSEINGELGGN